MTVDLTEEAWQRVLQVLATGPWQTVNPLIMEIGRQLQAQAPGGVQADGALNQAGRPNGADRNP